MTTRESREEAIERVLSGLQTMILMASRRAAGEQYAPNSDADVSDETIRWRKSEMAELRRLRKDFEDLTTGIISGEPTAWVLRVVGLRRDRLEECGEAIEKQFPGLEFSIRGAL